VVLDVGRVEAGAAVSASGTRLYAERRANNECVDCEDEPMKGRARCAACAKRKLAGVTAARDARILAQQCTRCSSPPLEDSEFCASCREKKNAASLRWWQTRPW
jgi:hypothetical protein